MATVVLAILGIALLLVLGGLLGLLLAGSHKDAGKKDPVTGKPKEAIKSGPGSRAVRGDGSSSSSDAADRASGSSQRASALGRMRHRRGRAAQAIAAAEEEAAREAAEHEVQEEEEEDDDEEGQEEVPGTKKERKKKEKEAKRQAEQASREAKDSRRDVYAERQRAKEEQREAEERRQAEEAAELEARQLAAVEAELDKWKDMFTVETEGSAEAQAEGESQGLLNEFVTYIERHKCVQLDDLAAQFGLRPEDAVNRVVALEQMGRISGVLDERGKFLYISQDEMKAVAKRIQSAGRVSISRLVDICNDLIDLEPREGEAEVVEGVELDWGIDDVPQGGEELLAQAVEVV